MGNLGGITARALSLMPRNGPLEPKTVGRGHRSPSFIRDGLCTAWELLVEPIAQHTAINTAESSTDPHTKGNGSKHAFIDDGGR